MTCIDFHTHAFPDELAPRAVAQLTQSARNADIKHYSDGSVRGLLASMDTAGIAQALVCSIATKPAQFDNILAFSRKMREEHGERLIPLLSVHPRDEQAPERLQLAHDEGFVGIKLHPYYQDFSLDDPALFPLYEQMSALGLILVVHSGFDVAFPRVRRGDPEQTLAVTRRFPELKLVATHVGGWDDWDEAERVLIGRPVYLELSFGTTMLEPERFRKMLLAHPAEYLLFGSDSPWTDQKRDLAAFQALNLPEALLERILFGNACRLLAR